MLFVSTGIDRIADPFERTALYPWFGGSNTLDQA